MEHPHGAYGDLHWMVFHLSAPKVHINVEWVKQKTPRMWGFFLVMRLKSLYNIITLPL